MRKKLMTIMTVALLAAVSGCAGSLEAVEKPNGCYSLAPDKHGVVLNAPNGKTVFRYMTVKPKKTNLAANSVCCFHPLNTPSGQRLTALAPGDHHHHRGVFLAWHTMDFREKADFSKFGPTGPTYGWNISRADFWGWGEFAPTQGRVIENRKVYLAKADAEEAELRIHNDWVTNERVMMTEHTSAKVREQDGVYVIDLDYRLTPALDMTLNHTAFGGFCVRARNDGESYYATAEGKVQLPDPHYSVPELNWPAKRWYDYTIKLNNGKTIGVGVIDHPDNPPATWHNPRYVWMVNPCIVAAEPVQVNKDKMLRLRYRLVVHDGPTPVELLKKLSSRFEKTSFEFPGRASIRASTTLNVGKFITNKRKGSKYDRKDKKPKDFTKTVPQDFSKRGILGGAECRNTGQALCGW